MQTTVCNKCGQTCGVIFRRYITKKDGTIVYPKTAKCFAIPDCNCLKVKS